MTGGGRFTLPVVFTERTESAMSDCKKQKYRIYQVDLENDTERFAFMDYDFLKSKGYVQPPAGCYRLVYESETVSEQQDKLLKVLFQTFNLTHPEDYRGRSMSVSDIVELYGNGKREFFFCDSFGFQPIDFDTDQALPRVE